MTYNVQQSLHEEGYFNVKETPLGANLCLLEGKEEGVLECWSFCGRRKKVGWENGLVKFTCGVPEMSTMRDWHGLDATVFHAMHGALIFFTFLVSMVGVFLFSGDKTKAQSKFEVARIMVKTKYNFILNETFNIGVNREAYSIKIVEDAYGPKRIVFPEGKMNGTNYDFEEDEDCSEEEGWEGSGIVVSLDPDAVEKVGEGVPENFGVEVSRQRTDVNMVKDTFECEKRQKSEVLKGKKKAPVVHILSNNSSEAEGAFNGE